MNSNSLLKRLGLVVPIISVVCGLALLLVDPLPLQALRNNLFDQYQRWHPRDYVEVPVRIVDIDDESLQRLGQWPWPRTRIAEMVGKLKGAGVAAIGFDVMFSEPDRTSPRAMAALWSLDAPLRAALDVLPDHDRVLAQSLTGAGAVLGFVVERGTSDKGPGMPPQQPFRYIYSGTPPVRWMNSFASAVSALPALQDAAQGEGALSFVPDADGVVRRVPLVLQLGGEPVPTLAAEVLRVAQGERNYVLKTEASDIGLTEIRIGQFRVPTTAQGEIWVHFSREVPGRYLSAWRVLAGEVPSAAFDGGIVLVGSSAQGLMDLRFSPLGRIIPGVEMHAQALEQILSGHILQRPGWARAAETLAIVLGALAIGFLAIRASALMAAGATAVCLGIVFWGGWYFFRAQALLLDSVTPVLVIFTTFVVGSLVHHFTSEREQRWIKAAFSRYVSPNRVRHLVEHPDDMELGGRRQVCSFVFTDLTSFTTLMEHIDPAEAVTLLNAYLDRMIAIAFSYDGTLDRIVGDAVAIMFSAPVIQPDHQARALACAEEMDRFAREYSAELNAKGVHFGLTRIGVHTGEVIVGNFGGSTIFDYRALGDAVNTASRLEAVNKHLGTTLCVSETTLAGCPGGVARPVGRLVLKGKSRELRVFEPLAAENAESCAPLEEYRAAYDLMADADSRSVAAFEDLARRWPLDPLVALHHRRLTEGAPDDLMTMHEK